MSTAFNHKETKNTKMIEHPAVFYGMTALVITLIGLSKGGLGGALGTLATPLMALVMPAEQVIGLILPLLMITDVFAVFSHWQRWDRRLVLLLIPGSLVGVTAGTYLITAVSGEALRTGLGVIVLFFVVYKVFEKRILGSLTYRPHNWHGVLTGTVAGFSSAMAHTGGPPVTIYLLMQDITPRMFIATSALYFMILNWIKLPYYIFADILHPEQLLQVVWLLPLIPVTVWVGKWAVVRVDRLLFERIIIALLAFSALLLIVR
jgi:uncharacterized protein